MTMAILIGCFTRMFSSEGVNFHDVCLAMAMDLHLRNYLEVHSLSSNQGFLSIINVFRVQRMDFKFFFYFELYYSLFHILMIDNSYWVDRAHFSFLFNSFEML